MTINTIFSFNTVPGRFYSTFGCWCKHWFIALFAPVLSLLGYIPTSWQLEARLDYNNRDLLVGYSCRALFDVVVSELRSRMKDDYQLRGVCTPFLHTGFQRIIDWQNVDADYLDIDNKYQFKVDDDKLRERDFLLITHVFGAPFPVGDLITRYKQLNPNGIIIEDCVQAGFLDDMANPHHPRSNVVLFSCGQDKIPVAFGGGLAFFCDTAHRDRVKLYTELHLPMDGYFSRLTHVSKKLLTLVVYNSKYVIAALKSMLYVVGYSPSRFALSYRKNVSGFVHERARYLKRPSAGQMASIGVAVDRCYNKERERCEQVRHIVQSEHHEYFPWTKSLGFKSSNFYTHIYIPDHEKDTFVKKMDQKGAIVLNQQSWFVNADASPVAYNICEHLMMLPSLHTLSEPELKTLLC